MVFTELIQNAVEHAFARKAPGTIEIRCAREGDGLRLSVEDDGVGLPEGSTWTRRPAWGCPS